MKSDNWFYAIFRDFPWLYFRLMGLPEDQAAHYRFDAVELKEISLRLDGIFCPERKGEPYYFLEAQLYKDREFYLKWMTRILLYNLKYRIEEDWRGLVLFGDRSHEPDHLHGISEWIASGRIQRVFLDELPDFPDASLEVAVLKLAVARPESLLDDARNLATVAKGTPADPKELKRLLDMIASFVVANFPQMTREEIEAMMQLGDIRKSVVYKEALQEGEVRGEAKITIKHIQRMHSKGFSVAEICDALEVDEKRVKAALASRPKNSRSKKPSA